MGRGGQTGLILLMLSCFLAPLWASQQVVQEGTQQVRRWNSFVEDLLKLHERLITQQVHVIKTRMGGDAHLPDFYKEYQYINKKTAKPISQLRWEKAYPDNLHTIDVYVYDDYGRVRRDYRAAYPTDYRRSPSQTQISFHAYNGLLHAVRRFDATGTRLLERCTGKFNAKQISILINKGEFYEPALGQKGVMQSDTYRECFKGLPKTAGRYLIPQ